MLASTKPATRFRGASSSRYSAAPSPMGNEISATSPMRYTEPTSAALMPARRGRRDTKLVRNPIGSAASRLQPVSKICSSSTNSTSTASNVPTNSSHANAASSTICPPRRVVPFFSATAVMGAASAEGRFLSALRLWVAGRGGARWGRGPGGRGPRLTGPAAGPLLVHLTEAAHEAGADHVEPEGEQEQHRAQREQGAVARGAGRHLAADGLGDRGRHRLDGLEEVGGEVGR